MENFEKVLLAYDGSENGRIALRRTLPLLGAGEVEVHLLAVVPLTGAVAAAEGFYTESMYEAERERIENILDEGVTLLKSRGVDAEGHLRAGEPAHQIAKLAEDLAVNLVVVGHQRRGVLARCLRPLKRRAGVSGGLAGPEFKAAARRRHDLDVAIVAEFDNIENIKQAIEDGAGVAILPEATLRREVQRRTLVKIGLQTAAGDTPFVRPLNIIHRRKRRLNPAVTEFIKVLCAPGVAGAVGRQLRGPAADDPPSSSPPPPRG